MNKSTLFPVFCCERNRLDGLNYEYNDNFPKSIEKSRKIWYNVLAKKI